VTADSRSSSRQNAAFLRRSAAVILILALAVVTAYSHLTSHLRVCEDIVARVGTKATVLSCRPLDVTDAPVIFVLILALLCILPDMQRIGIAGVVDLERRVDQQQQRVEHLASRIEMIVSTRSSANVNIGSFQQTLPADVSVTVDEGKLAEKEQLLAQEIGEAREQG
jgi:hypothetical protein